MKALILNTLYSPNIFGGAEKSTQLLAEGLQELGVEPVVVSTAPSRALGKVNGIKIYYLPLKNVYWPFDDRKRHTLVRGLWHLIDIYNPLMVKAVGAIIDEEHPDLVHTNNVSGFSVGIWKAVKSRGLPLIHTLRDYYLFCPRSAMFHNGQNCLMQCWNCRWFSYPKLRLSSLVDYVVGVSSFILRRHCESGYFPAAGRKTIHNPSLPQKQFYKPQANGDVRFGYIGKLHQSKGAEDILIEFRKLDRGKASLRLAGTGDLSYVSFLREHYAASNIAFLGFVPPDELYKQIDVLIVPSRWQEPLPRVVLEAYSRGTPVIATNRGGIPEIVEEGRTGFLYEPDKPRELAYQMQKFLKEPGLSKAMAQNCWEKAGELTQTTISRQYLDLYKSI